MDPFVGGGTTIVVADKLNRNWIGIDQSVQAIKVSEMRLNKQQSSFTLTTKDNEIFEVIEAANLN